MRKHIETIIILLAVAVFLAATHVYITFYTPPSTVKAVRTVTIERGMSFRLVADGLEKAGVIRDAESFSLAARILGVYKKVKAGEYEFTTDMPPVDVLELLVKGKVKRYFVTIPEGYNLRDVAFVLKTAGLAEPEVFMARATDPELALSLGVEGPTLEGYLFPDTYEFTRGMKTDEMIARMAGRFIKGYSEFEGEASRHGMSMRKVVTLASLIEKETGAPEEREVISAVFHNRLKKGIKLQSDPTVIYGINGFDGNIRKSHLSIKSPYNTYRHYGFPPGPIANPGRESISAALRPAKADFIYFVSRNDGSHQFSRTLKEHNRAVDEFQRQNKAKQEEEKKIVQEKTQGEVVPAKRAEGQ